MNLQEVLFCLEDEVKRNSLIYKIKEAGDQSLEFQLLRKILETFRLNKHSKGSAQTTILKHTFKFCEAIECFKNFSSVSKSWNLAVETLKLNQFPPPAIFQENQARMKKLLTQFKYLDYSYDEEKEEEHRVVLQSMKHLKYLALNSKNELSPSFHSFMNDLVSNSVDSLEDLKLPNLLVPNPCPDFMQLTNYHTYIPPTNDASAVIENFEHSLKKIINASREKLAFNLHSFEIGALPDHISSALSDHIVENYKDNCIFGQAQGMNSSARLANLIPMKMIKLRICLFIPGIHLNFSEFTYSSEIQYLQLDFVIRRLENWVNFEETLDGLPNLKGIYFSCPRGDNHIVFPEISKFLHKSGKTSYLKTRGIQIMNTNEFVDQNAKLCENISWSLNILQKH